MKRDPFAAVEAALSGEASDADDAIARIDFGREARTGIPEVVYGDSKSDEQIIAACRSILERLPRAIVSRIDPERATSIATAIGKDIDVAVPYPGRTAVLSLGGWTGARTLVIRMGVDLATVRPAGTGDFVSDRSRCGHLGRLRSRRAATCESVCLTFIGDGLIQT